MSVALTEPERSAFAAEARRRGLGLSTAIRALAFERVAEVEEQRQRERARRWQTERLDRVIEQIEREGVQEATQEQVDALFTPRATRARRTRATTRR